MSDIYKHPKEYDLEHLGDDKDIGFYLSLLRSLKPRRVLELGCGTGRITLPIAKLGAQASFETVGLDNQPEMLAKAEEHRAREPEEVRSRLNFINDDMRTWAADSKFDLIIIPCSSLSHVLELADQIAIFQRCNDNLATIVRSSALVAAVGFGSALLLPDRASALIGLILLGLGFSTVIPLVIRASSRASRIAAGYSLGVVTGVGSVGMVSLRRGHRRPTGRRPGAAARRSSATTSAPSTQDTTGTPLPRSAASRMACSPPITFATTGPHRLFGSGVSGPGSTSTASTRLPRRAASMVC